MKRKIETALAAVLPFAAVTILAGCARQPEVVAIHYPSAAPSGPPPAAPSEVARAIDTLPHPDREFVQQALGANLAAIRLGQLAMERGTSPAVRDFGREMMDSHTLLNDHLRETARAEGNFVLPVPRMTPLQEATYARLSQLSGPEFDHEMLQSVLTEQQRTIDSFHREAQVGQNPGLRDFASSALPLLNDRVRYVRNEIQMM